MSKRQLRRREARVHATEIPVDAYLTSTSVPRAMQAVGRLQQSPGATQQEPPPCEPGFLYTLRPGDTLRGLEARFGVRAQDILDANPQIAGPEALIAGEPICIPFVEPEDCPSGFVLEVDTGETLHSIAESFGVSVEEIIALNPHLANPDLILPGFRLCLPEEALQGQTAALRRRAGRGSFADLRWEFGVSTFSGR